MKFVCIVSCFMVLDNKKAYSAIYIKEDHNKHVCSWVLNLCVHCDWSCSCCLRPLPLACAKLGFYPFLSSPLFTRVAGSLLPRRSMQCPSIFLSEFGIYICSLYQDVMSFLLSPFHSFFRFLLPFISLLHHLGRFCCPPLFCFLVGGKKTNWFVCNASSSPFSLQMSCRSLRRWMNDIVSCRSTRACWQTTLETPNNTHDHTGDLFLSLPSGLLRSKSKATKWLVPKSQV